MKRIRSEGLINERLMGERLMSERLMGERLMGEKLMSERLMGEGSKFTGFITGYIYEYIHEWLEGWLERFVKAWPNQALQTCTGPQECTVNPFEAHHHVFLSTSMLHPLFSSNFNLYRYINNHTDKIWNNNNPIITTNIYNTKITINNNYITITIP